MPRNHNTCPFLSSLLSCVPSIAGKVARSGTSFPTSNFLGSLWVGIVVTNYNSERFQDFILNQKENCKKFLLVPILVFQNQIRNTKPIALKLANGM